MRMIMGTALVIQGGATVSAATRQTAVSIVGEAFHTNVLLEIANEHDIVYRHDIIRRLEELIRLAKQRAAERSFALPGNWQISSDRKRSFFNMLAEMTTGTTDTDK